MNRHLLPAVTLIIAFTPAMVAQSAPPSTRQFSIVHAFQGGYDGAFPGYAKLIFDSEGNMYGATTQGGKGVGQEGCGTVFKIDKAGTVTILYSFGAHKNDGCFPYGTLFRTADGTFYGTTWGGGTSGDACNNYGCGTVWTLNPKGKERFLYNFTGGSDGATPTAGLTRGADGRFYSTTHVGGLDNYGVVFAVDTEGNESVVHDFDGAKDDGDNPWSGFVRDSSGTLYGMTFAGGTENSVCGQEFGCGVIYNVDSSGVENVLYRFTGASNGMWPAGDLVRDDAGNLYGADQAGTGGHGTVFKLDPAGNLSVLHTFAGGSGGSNPWAGLVRDEHGNLYGTTYVGGGTACPGGYGCGTVFEVSAAGKFRVLHEFQGSDGFWPSAALALDAEGNLYGTTDGGGTYNEGEVFEISK
jgi:uncharacterized repeat protein (TIGR03803 family)